MGLTRRKTALAQHSLPFTFAIDCEGMSILFSFLCMLARVGAQNRSSEVQALLSFKAANQAVGVTYTQSFGTTNDIPVGYWSTWKATDENACAWVGTSCTTNFTVEKLDLSGWGLLNLDESQGLEMLSNLTDLRELDLSSNNLGNGGPIPNDFQTLTGLIRLDLSRNNFSGPIPLNFSTSRRLRYISLQENYLTGVIPSSLRDFVNLEVLLLGSNQLAGAIPTELGEIRSLITIDLSDNTLSGAIPSLSNLTNLVDLKLDDNSFNVFDGALLPGTETLEHLSVSNNLLEGSIPSGITSLVNLKFLDLSFNGLAGEIPPNISACRNLQYISLESNTLDGPIPSQIGRLVNLQGLLLAQNEFSGAFPIELGEIESLTILDVSSNQFTGKIPSLTNLTNLVDLNLGFNVFTGFISQLPGTQSLERLFLNENFLSGSIPTGLANLTNLQFLNMSSNNLTGGIPFGLSQEMNHSFNLGLAHNSLTGSIPADLLQSSTSDAVISIDLSFNFLSGSIQFDRDKQHTYDVLDLSNNDLSGPIPFFYNNSNTIISYLRLQNNHLSEDLGDFFANGPSLLNSKDLRLGNNLFSGDLSRIALVSIPFNSMEVLDFSDNNLQMSITKEFPNPWRAMFEKFNSGGVLTEFRIGGNDLSGNYLPWDLGNQSSLEVFDLSNNHLKGEMLGSVFNSTLFPALHVLNLSNNDVTGIVPESVVLFPDLEVLDLTNNSLSGPLPAIQPNNRLYNESFFSGNVGLCGGPLPPCPKVAKSGVRWWVFMIIVGGSTVIAIGSCSIAAWRLRVYNKRHQQDADLIKTLMERESASLMSLRELRKATKNFSESAQIGEGGFGTVYMGVLSDGTQVAIKRSKREGLERDKVQFLNEVRILSQVNHRHLVKLLGCCLENKIPLLVFEFVSNGTLQEHLQGKIKATSLSWKQRVSIALQTSDALNYLHSAASYPIYHRDVKSANILLDDALNAKVADFGISKLAPIEATHVSTIAVQGTIGYIDPEYYTSYQLTDRSDVYSFGVVLLELISAKPAIDILRGGDETSLVNFASPHIRSGDLQQMIDPALMETYNDPTGHGRESILKLGRLAMSCLDMRSKTRPSMTQVWKELQNLWLELNGTSKVLVSIIEDDYEGPEVDEGVLRSLSLPIRSFSSALYGDSNGIQLSEFPRFTS